MRYHDIVVLHQWVYVCPNTLDDVGQGRIRSCEDGNIIVAA